ncbi:MAG: outer membrane beta-barrel protein [Bacteroidota bacterium]
MKKLLLISSMLMLTTVHVTFAQTTKKQAIKAAVGFGYSIPYDDVDVSGEGFFAQGEYVYEFYNWLDVRPYAGVIFATSKEEDNEPREAGFRSDANAFFLGGKARVTAPIPWVAPYLEIGIGVSFGKLETITDTTNIEESGVSYHIPFSVGLELGPKRNFDVSFTYLFHPSAEQFVGAAAIGFTFPLN